MRQKRGLTLEQHRAMGSRLGLIKDELVCLSCDIDRAYPKKETRDVFTAIDKLSLIKSFLDDQLAKEYPELDDQTFLNIYYGDLSGTRKGGC